MATCALLIGCWDRVMMMVYTLLLLVSWRHHLRHTQETIPKEWIRERVLYTVHHGRWSSSTVCSATACAAHGGNSTLSPGYFICPARVSARNGLYLLLLIKHDASIHFYGVYNTTDIASHVSDVIMEGVVLEGRNSPSPFFAPRDHVCCYICCLKSKRCGEFRSQLYMYRVW